ncbi:MAG TPA: hypothetical protein VFA56_09465 [Gaiellaceae bacterium]|nr:hypothetical protein [Gaiellaceae bacterium]
MSAAAQNNSNQTGLVNVSLGDVNLLNNTNLAVAANIAATVCGVNVPVALLAQQVIAGGENTICDTTAGPLAVTQSQNGPPATPPNAGGNNSRQNGLVNVGLGDVNVLNGTNLAVAANVAATVCGVAVPVAVLADQLILGGGITTVCTTDAGPLTVQQAA